MELKLVNGEYIPNTEIGAGFETVTGMDELIQRVIFKLKVRRGSFPLLPGLGSDLWRLYKEKRSKRRSAAYQYVCQALSDEPEINIDDVEVSETGDCLRIEVELSYNGTTALMAVEI